MKKILVFLILFKLIANTCLADNLKMATTTSVESSGLLDALLPAFGEKFEIKIHAIAVGTGKALKLAENGDVDLVIVHCPRLEIEFMKKGFGLDRKTVFYNDFVIIGPNHDPAKIRNLKDVNEVFRAIAKNQSIFVSRGDGSGTHQKEQEIWCEDKLLLKDPWHVQTGQGMGATLMIADEKDAYCLVDRGTYIFYEDKIELVILYEGDPLLVNPYSVITVNPVRELRTLSACADGGIRPPSVLSGNDHRLKSVAFSNGANSAPFPHVKYREAKLFIDWISSEEGKAIINGLRKQQKALFHSFD